MVGKVHVNAVGCDRPAAIKHRHRPPHRITGNGQPRAEGDRRVSRDKVPVGVPDARAVGRNAAGPRPATVAARAVRRDAHAVDNIRSATDATRRRRLAGALFFRRRQRQRHRRQCDRRDGPAPDGLSSLMKYAAGRGLGCRLGGGRSIPGAGEADERIDPPHPQRHRQNDGHRKMDRPALQPPLPLRPLRYSSARFKEQMQQRCP